MLTGDQLMDIFEGLEINDLATYTHLLTGKVHAHVRSALIFTGYVNSPTTLRNIMQIYAKLKEKNPNLIYGT